MKKNLLEALTPVGRLLLKHMVDEEFTPATMGAVIPDGIDAMSVKRAILELIDVAPREHIGAVGSLVLMVSESGKLCATLAGVCIKETGMDAETLAKKVADYRQRAEAGEVTSPFGDDEETPEEETQDSE